MYWYLLFIYNSNRHSKNPINPKHSTLHFIPIALSAFTPSCVMHPVLGHALTRPIQHQTKLDLIIGSTAEEGFFPRGTEHSGPASRKFPEQFFSRGNDSVLEKDSTMTFSASSWRKWDGTFCWRNWNSSACFELSFMLYFAGRVFKPTYFVFSWYPLALAFVRFPICFSDLCDGS
jgi:hypothetical protein